MNLSFDNIHSHLLYLQDPPPTFLPNQLHVLLLHRVRFVFHE